MEGLKILVVDCDFYILSGLRKAFERDHAVKVRSDGASAIQIAKSWDPDVVVVDLRLSGENGLDVIEALRPLLPYANIVFMTSHPGTEIREEAFASGADWFVGKEELALLMTIVDRVEASRSPETLSA